jgi:GntR family transcriptional regulator, transcriptional repressor for pyruvate dehydrogenase complex
MPIQVIESRRLYLQIADQVRSLIAAGEFPPGSRLPPERELAKQFGVSRPSMREALIALEVEGYVEVRPGSGILVTTPESGAQDCSGDEGPLEVLRVRSLIEGTIAEQVAKEIEQKDIAALQQILVAMEREATAQGRLAADRQFHLYIAAKPDNKVLLRLVTGLLDQAERPWARQFAVHFDNAETCAAVLAEHLQIVAALAARDPGQAREAMRNHLQKAHDRWAVEPDRGAKTGFEDGGRQPTIDGIASGPVASLE